MCIVIDINLLDAVFNEKNKHQADFLPVRKWIIDGKGCAVYGGTKYKNELIRAGKYKLFRLLKDGCRAAEIDPSKVDAEHQRINGMPQGKGFNDQHIIAIFIVSGCRLFCSNDKRSYKYIKDKSFYPRGQRRPCIYRSITNKNLLCKKYIVNLRNVIGRYSNI